MDNLEKNLNNFFVFADIFLKSWSVCVKDTEIIFKGLKNLSEQLECVHRCRWDEILLKKFPDIKNRLIFKIHAELEEESCKLKEIWDKLSSLNNDLLSKMDLIERNVKNQCLDGLTSLGNIVPPILILIENAEFITRHYNVMLIQITSALNLMDFKNQKSVVSLEEAFLKSVTVPENVKEMLAVTSHFTGVPTSNLKS